MNAKEMVTNAVTQQTQSRGIARQSDLVDVFTMYKGSIEQSLPKAAKDLNAQRIIQIAATVMGSKPELMKAAANDPGAAVAAVMQAAILGFNPIPQLAECYFVPRGGKINFEIGYKGWVTLYHRCNVVRDVSAYVVCDGDEFEYEYGAEPILRHKAKVVPAPNGANVTHAYAIVNYVNGGRLFTVLTKSEIELLAGRGGGKGPSWKSDYEAMAQAKALKKLKRFVPTDSSIAAAMATDGEALSLDGFDASGGGFRAELLPAPSGDDVVAAIVNGTDEPMNGELVLDDAKKQPPHAATE